jgi:hypothetical protein
LLSAGWRIAFLWECLTRKSPGASHQGFFFVAEADEISNLELLDDIIKIFEI